MIIYGEWESYIWKRELESQIRHASIYYDELILDLDFIYHNPLHSLEHSIILAAFSIRRMIEKKLLTDKLSKKEIPVHVYYTKDPKDEPPSIYRTPCLMGIIPVTRSYDEQQQLHKRI